MASSSKPVFVIVTGSGMTPSHYGYLQYLLYKQGYGALSALLPTVGITAEVSAQDDADYIRSRMIMPVLDIEKHDVILVFHSYGGMPGSAAAQGLSKAERVAEGKLTSVLGQIFVASIIPRGGDGKDVVATFGGQLPPHIQVNEDENLIRCEDPKPPLFQDVPAPFADAAVASSISHSLTSFKTPCPAASWYTEGYKGRCAYIKTTKDQAVPYEVQNMMLQGTGQEWITREMETGHSPQLAAPEDLARHILELAEMFVCM